MTIALLILTLCSPTTLSTSLIPAERELRVGDVIRYENPR